MPTSTVDQLPSASALTGAELIPVEQSGILCKTAIGSAFVAKSGLTGSALLPVGTTAQRDSVPATGMLRANSDYANKLEVYNGASWTGLGGASGASGNAIFYENDQTVTASYTITTGKNAMSAGKITINSGVTVTVPTSSRWVIV